jgi:hypothetical protein
MDRPEIVDLECANPARYTFEHMAGARSDLVHLQEQEASLVRVLSADVKGLA